MPEFRNPNAGGAPSQDNRSFMLMLLVFLAIAIGVQYWHARTAPPTPENSPAATAPATTAPKAAATTAQTAAAAAAAAQTPAVQATAESTTVVENELYKITFSNRGGQVTSWVLKRYKDDDGKPLDLVDHAASAKFGYPMSLYTYDAGLTQTLANAMFVPSATGNLAAPATLTFHYAANGLDVTKTFSFGQDYLIHADTQVMKDGSPVRALLSWPSGTGDLAVVRTLSGRSTVADPSVDTMQNGKDEHIASKKVSGGATLNGPFDFAGVSDQYFAATILPDHTQGASVVTLHNQLSLNDLLRAEGKPANSKDTQLSVLGAAVGDVSGHTQARIFVGPKNLKLLKSVKTVDGYSLEPLLDFGFWGPIAKYLFVGLQTVHTWIAPASTPATANPGAHDYSWGWAIVIFTILIYMLLVPLRFQSMKGMIKMQRIQPQIDAIKAKYKNPKPTDPKMAEMNAEIMDLQKKNGVSMFGGCIPTLVQFPLLFAFFTMMTKVVELRQAHWFWLPDLSQPDPWHILPIIMIVTSFLVQFYTPSPGVDPAQQRMMAFLMPAFSGYWTWNYAAGLALYWNVGNFIMVGQQLILNRTALGREMREIQLKRAQAKAQAKAAPRTIQGRR